MANEVSVNIGCQYEDFLRGLATVKKEADLAVIEQRKKDQAEREARRAAQRQERAEQRAAEREKEEAARRQKRNADAELRQRLQDVKEREKAEKAAQQAAQTSKEKKAGVAQGFISGGLTGGISALGALGGPMGMLGAELANKFIEGFKQAIQEAKELRNLSYATDISTGELRKLQVVAEQSGISLSQFAHAVAEFNKNMGKAKIGGSELNNLLNKLGVSQDDLKNNSYDYSRALRDLAKAHTAGTDAATLAYYGNLMFGSSFEQLLPLIKRGTGEIERSMQGIYQTSELANSVLSDMSDRWDKFWSNFKNIAAEGFAAIDLIVNAARNTLVVAGAKGMAMFNPEAAAALLNSEAAGGPEARRILGKAVSAGLPEDKQKRFEETLDKLLKGESGTKLTPLGLQTAQGASTIQQMGGGDIVSAVAFSPAQATAEATAKTAENTYKTNELLERYTNRSPIRNAPRR